MLVGRKLILLALACLAAQPAAWAQVTHNEEEDPLKAKGQFTRKQMDALLDESLTALNKGKALLRLLSIKLPEMIKDNNRFRAIDRAVELCREETYPAVAAAEALKKNPRALRENVRLYSGMRLLQLRCVILAEKLQCPAEPETAQAASKIMDLSNRFGNLTLKLHPYTYKVIDTYESAAPAARVDTLVPLETEGSF